MSIRNHIAPTAVPEFSAGKLVGEMSCKRCTGLLRLVGTEPHPVYAATDLFTYVCTRCDAVQVLTVPLRR